MQALLNLFKHKFKSFSRRPLLIVVSLYGSHGDASFIACHTAATIAEWLMIFISFFIKNFTNLLAIAGYIRYSDCQICASGWVLLFKHLYNDRVSWAVCTMGGAILVSFYSSENRMWIYNTSIPPLLTKYMKVSGRWTGRRIGSNVKLLTQCVSEMNKTCRLIIIERIIIAASIDISVYFTNSKSFW